MKYRALTTLVFALMGCAGGGSGPGVGPAPDGGTPLPGTDGGYVAVPPEQGCAAGQSTTITGRVLFPNATLPVSGAFVYVSNGGAAPAHTGECGECIDASSLLAHTTTAADGSFTLAGIPAGAQTVVVEKGKFRRTAQVQVAQCVANPVPDEQIRLPRNTTEGTLPRIAVLQGAWDYMEQVLSKLGMSPGSYQVIGEFDDASESMFRDRNALAAYDIIFVNCGAPIGLDLAQNDTVVREAVRGFVEGGGRLYVTDLSYNLIEQTFPERVDFSGDRGGDGLSAIAEEVGASAEGDLVPLPATVHDAGLGAWLVASGASTTPTSIPVTFSLGGWALMERIDATKATTWVSGGVERADSGRGAPTVESPLTVTFEQGCGRALYTSYHTVDEDYQDEGVGALTAQELVLAYLVLEIGTCIEEPTLF